jgi:PIN domain nuclease of toxin-antitoxin system
VILLDTNAILWLVAGHKRAKNLADKTSGLLISPVSLWELAMLAELGRIRISKPVEDDERWVVDDPSSRALFREAASIGWTTDPFDRLLVAHASVRRFKLATGDSQIIDHLPASRVLVL